jgi:hypothetical protein
MARLEDLQLFYELLDRLKAVQGGMRTLAECHGRMDWPKRGVYFFFERGERRSDSGEGPRVTRVGTHALTTKSRTTLWNRLSQHRGVESTGGGNHRGSIFRLLVGAAFKQRDGIDRIESWGIGSDPGAAARKLGIDRSTIRNLEHYLEQMVSHHIGAMPLLYLKIDDAPGGESLRGQIEQNSIALLSNFERDSLDSPSSSWLGRYSDRPRVRESGLWNNNHVDQSYDSRFLVDFERLIQV